LGVDSLIGQEWLRELNRTYGTSIDGEREPSAAGGGCGSCPARVFPGGAGARAVMASAFRRVAATFD
ncbi:hypothetical protein, partial [Burkholderia pseudomallei]|uniref:hypothetical protein n=1 Tax=Burkholderia pseudomallei TaxID=28450 RepID=UPI003AF84B78